MLKFTLAILFATFAFISCKKTSDPPAPANQSGGVSQPQTNYKRLKSTRSVAFYAPSNWGPHISNTAYYYSSSGKLASFSVNDSVYYNNVWNVSSNSISFSYAVNGKIRSLTWGIDSVYYVYDASNKVKYEISGADTTKFVHSGNTAIATSYFSSGYSKKYYTQNMDSVINYDLSNVITGWSKDTYNNAIDLSYAYINQFAPIVDSHNELIQNHQYPTGTLPAIRSYTYTYDNSNYPVKRVCIDETMTYTYY